MAQCDITDFVLYVIDSFDFEGMQVLGVFKSPDRISKNPFDGGTVITNADYQTFRNSPEANGKGGDFLVISDARTIHLPKSFTFAPDSTLNGTWTSSDAKHRFILEINGNAVVWTETGVETGIVVKRSLNLTSGGDGWRIDRPNTEAEVLRMLGYQNPTLQQAILNSGPHPSFLQFKMQNSQLVAKWAAIRVQKTPQGAFKKLIQPEDPAYPASDYTLSRLS